MPTGTVSFNGCMAQKTTTRTYQTTAAHTPMSANRRLANIPTRYPPMRRRRCLWYATARRYTVARMSLRSAAAHRNLLYLLSLKELRTRYKKSVLGWAWSLLNPLTQMAIFTRHLPVRLQGDAADRRPERAEELPALLPRGVLPFNFFSISVGVVDGRGPGWRRADQEGAVPPRAPRVLGGRRPVRHAADRAARADGGAAHRRQHGAAVAAGAAARCCVLLAVFTTGVALALSAANVFYHDVNYLWGILVQILFYATPMIWNPATVGVAVAHARSPTTARPAASSSPSTT